MRARALDQSRLHTETDDIVEFVSFDKGLIKELFELVPTEVGRCRKASKGCCTAPEQLFCCPSSDC